MRPRAAILTGILAFVVFSAGVVHLFSLRFKSGDIFPVYSSLRSDPLGTRVLYQALAERPSLEVSRNYRDVQEIALSPDTALLYLGDTLYPNQRVSRKAAAGIDAFLRKGGRCVVTLYPRNIDPGERIAWEKEHEDDKKKEEQEEADDSDEEDADADEKDDGESEDEDIEKRLVRVSAWLGFSTEDTPLTNRVDATLSSSVSNALLPAAISCHSSRVFKDLEPGWQILYERDGRPVIIERKIGDGSLVFSTLSYFVSNEAMRDDRLPGLLTWMLGNKTRIIFDETHHQITEAPNIAVLAREHNLYWIAGVLLVLGILFIWQNVTSLVPPYQPGEIARMQDQASGKGSASGLTNLLRSNIPASQVLQTCLEEWEQHLGSAPGGKAATRLPVDDTQKAKIRQLVQLDQQAGIGRHKPVQVYNQISKILNERRPHGNHETQRSTG